MSNDQTPGRETVTIPAAEFNALMQRVSNLEQKDRPSIAPSAVKDNNVAIAFLDGKPVVALANKGDEKAPRYTYESPDPIDPRQTILYTDVIVRNEDGSNSKPIKIKYSDLQNAVYEDCKVTATKVEEHVAKHGWTDRVEVPGDEYNMKATGERVPLDVVTQSRTLVVTLPNGSSLEIDAQYVNINRAPPQS